MHFIGTLFLLPFVLGFGLLKLVFFVALIVLLVRLVRGPRQHWAHHGYYGPRGPWTGEDPRRIAAMRYASGRISREEFDAIMRDLDATPQPSTSV